MNVRYPDKADDFQAELFQIEMIAASFLHISRGDLVLFRVRNHWPVAGAVFFRSGVVRKLVPDDSVEADFDFAQLKEPKVGIIPRLCQKRIFENNQVWALTVEDFVVDKLKRDDTVLAKREDISACFQFSATLRRTEHDLRKLVLAIPSARADLIRNDSINIRSRLFRIRLFLRERVRAANDEGSEQGQIDLCRGHPSGNPKRQRGITVRLPSLTRRVSVDSH